MNRVSLSMRLIALLALLAVVITTVTVVLVLAINRVNDNRMLVASRFQPASVQSRALLVGLVDQETGQRGYVLTGDDAFLDPYREGRRDVARSLASLRKEFPDDAEMLAAIDEVETAAETWQQVGARPEIAARRADEFDVAQELVRVGRGKRAFEEVRVQVAQLQTLIDLRLAAARQEDRENLRLLRLTGVIGVGAVVLIVGLTAYLLRRWALVPLQTLRRRMRAVAGGHLDDEVIVEGPPEIAAVSHDAESMRRRILTELDAARGATEALLQHSPVVAALGSALAGGSPQQVGPVAVSGTVLAAEGVLAGDTWHVLHRPSGSTAALVTDVSGHGPEAGLVAFAFKQRLGALLATDLGLLDAFERAAIWTVRDDERFVTAAVVEVHDDGRLVWVNAGHPAPLVLGGPFAGVRAQLEQTGPIVSSVSSGWTAEEMRLAPGELVLIYTDGVVEARDPEGNELGEQGLVAALSGIVPWTPDAVVLRVGDVVRRFDKGVRRDDVTCVALGYARSDPGTTVP
ncbi:PP2C family protein-serine/threonine phosphatase [Nocardioides iriomotensis]|uniref:HAMP domain-containing protein n=1 Tax=Nocardioides iriomotensis TaxID=715784 RepID=A0A4Q5J3P9_9ACTN|nr:CHASE3 domain-containing protein [Nocardioides iriomotensis]RYU12288.1 HAMP domain-containing protein [Nocardioides iriomotensis]